MQEEQKKFMEECGLEESLHETAPGADPPLPPRILEPDICL